MTKWRRDYTQSPLVKDYAFYEIPYDGLYRMMDLHGSRYVTKVLSDFLYDASNSIFMPHSITSIPSLENAQSTVTPHSIRDHESFDLYRAYNWQKTTGQSITQEVGVTSCPCIACTCVSRIEAWLLRQSPNCRHPCSPINGL